MGFELPPATIKVVFVTGSGTYQIIDNGVNYFTVNLYIANQSFIDNAYGIAAPAIDSVQSIADAASSAPQ